MTKLEAKRRAARPGLLPLVPVYAAVLGVKAWLLERGWLRRRRLGRPVISVGSVSAGGAGKTPVVLLLAELLGRAGFAVRILSRGYGRGSAAVERVDAGGEAARYGDEPMLLARRLAESGAGSGAGPAVYVGADRYAAGILAERDGAVDVFLLDDGFQHRKLARDLDVVLLTQRDVEDRLLPGGNLREPLRALARADVVVLREEDAGLRELVAEVCCQNQNQNGNERALPAIWVIRRRLLLPAALPARPVVFSGIARPEGFLAMLAELGCAAVAEVRFRDHHRYTEADIDRLLRVAREQGADGFVTTEKDAVKLSGGMLERMGRVVAPELRVELVDEAAAMELLVRTVERGQAKTDTGELPLRSER